MEDGLILKSRFKQECLDAGFYPALINTALIRTPIAAPEFKLNNFYITAIHYGDESKERYKYTLEVTVNGKDMKFSDDFPADYFSYLGYKKEKTGIPLEHYNFLCNSDGVVVSKYPYGYECPFCGDSNIKNFCPTCGAKMVGEEFRK